MAEEVQGGWSECRVRRQDANQECIELWISLFQHLQTHVTCRSVDVCRMVVEPPHRWDGGDMIDGGQLLSRNEHLQTTHSKCEDIRTRGRRVTSLQLPRL